MKFTTLLLIISIMQVSASSMAQKITMSKKNAPLREVLNSIRTQTGYDFVLDGKALREASPVTIEVKNADFENVLQQVFEGQALNYKIKHKSVVITKKEAPSFLDRAAAVLDGFFQSDVRGHVVDENNEPLNGAFVMVKGAKSGTRTNEKGEFVIKAVPEDVLVVTFLGYKAQELKVGNRKEFSVKMVQDVNELDKVVIQAYGTTSDRLRTGNIATVTGAEIERQPVMNPLLALQGKVAGLEISQTSGYASGIVKAEIRGRTSVNNIPADPLYIIDGVPLTILDLQPSRYDSGSVGVSQSGVLSPANGQSPIFNLNAADIESVSVLKDADATAIYGSRAANGVILITTKKAKAQKARVEGNIQRGISSAIGKWEMMNTVQYLEMRKEALKNDGLTITSGNAYDILTWDQTRNTDWQKYLWGKKASELDSRIGISGGDAVNSFRISLGYHNEDAITTATGNDSRFTAHSNITHRSIDQRFTLDLTNMYSYTSSNMIYFSGNATVAPNAPSVYDNLGNLNYSEWNITFTPFPYGNLLQPYNSKTSFLKSNLNFTYRITTGLQFLVNLGYLNFKNDANQLIPISSQNPARNPQGTSQQGFVNSMNLISEPQVTYDFTLKKGKISTLLGGSFQYNNTSSSTLLGYGYLDDAFLGSIGNAPQKNITDGTAQYKYAAVFARANYNIEDTYIFNVSARRDGSSRFGPGKQFGNFGAIGAAWIFTNYKWIKENFDFLTFAKLRASYGITGSDRIGDYQYLSQWSSNGTLPYNGYSSNIPQQHANDNYHWESNRKKEVSIDLHFLKDRINIETSWYRNRCNNQLILLPVPLFTGFPNVTANSPADVQNQGVELILKNKVVDRSKFNVSTTLMISRNRNKLIAFPNLDQSPFAGSYRIGHPLTIRPVLHYTGVDPQTGLHTIEDKNSDGRIRYRSNEPDNDLYYIDLTPKYIGSFGTNVILDNFQLDVFFSFKKRIGRNAITTLVPGTINQNQPTVFLNRWQKPGDQAEYAKYTTSSSSDPSYFYYMQSDALYTDASYIRLQNIALSYQLPSTILRKLRINSGKIYSHGQNMLTLTNYKGLDPETTSSFGALPPQRVLTFGVQLSL